ncbi:MAG: amidophosphoribosyltransferase [Candidatus Doudnabacteria bacterium]|nr:amidophosphoribosyltransferase [Candidatus Doudnabacteria bacterium]
MCGIAGIINKNHDVATEIYDGLIALQHRGQDAAGMATFSQSFHSKKGLGMVREVFGQQDIESLKGRMGIGHVRYPTAGGIQLEDAQPFLFGTDLFKTGPGLALAHNGNIFNALDLKHDILDKQEYSINSNNDAAIMLHIMGLDLSARSSASFFDYLCNAVKSIYQKAKGGYSVVALVANQGLMAFRDPHGVRPLVWGTRNGMDHIFASEDSMFGQLKFKLKRDLEPGELVFVGLNGQVKSKIILQKEFRPCIFEYVYFARPDATLNGVNVYRARQRMGENLAKKIKRIYPNLPIDAVIPAPDSASTAALSAAYTLGAKYSQALVKNMFIGRTFIMPGQEIRQQANHRKLSVIDQEVRGQNVLVIDDSIVRGNVSRHIVKLLREHGAKAIYFASASPALRWPDLYGIDLPTREEYVAYNRTEEQIREFIGADVLIYQDLADLIEAVMREGNLKFKRMHTAYFDGDYPTGDVDEKVLVGVEGFRKEQKSTYLA